MECVIENNNFGYIFAENIDTSVDTLNMCGVVKGSEVAKALNSFNNFVCYKCALLEK